MLPPQLAHILLPVIVAVSILLMLIRPRGIAEVYWVGFGALLLVLLRLVSLKLAGKAVVEGSDVYLFLTGMMLLSELAREHGVFDWLSSAATRSAHGSCIRLFTLVYGIGRLHPGHPVGGAQGQGAAFAIPVRMRPDRQRGVVCSAHF